MPSDASSGMRRRTATGAAWTGIATAYSAGVGFLVTVVLVRMMSPIDYGILATAVATSGLVSVVSSAGLAQAVPQVAAAERELRGDAGLRAAAAVAIQLSGALALVVLITTLCLFAINTRVGISPALGVALVALTPLIAVVPLSGALAGLLQASYRPRAWAASVVVNSTALILAVSGLLVAGYRSAVPMGIARSAAAVATLGFLTLYTWKWLWGARDGTKVAPQVEAHQVVTPRGVLRRRLVAIGGALFLNGVFGSALSQLDVLLLGLTHGPRAAAVYQPLSRVLDLLFQLSALVGAFFLPIASALAARGEVREVRDLFHWASRWVLAVGAALLALLIVCPDALLHTLFGARFPAPVAAARILGAGAAVNVALGLNGMTVVAFGQARLVARRLAVALAVEVAACAILIPLWGIVGAALATSIAVVAANGLCAAQLVRRYQIPPWNRAGILTVCGFGASLFIATLAAVAVRSPDLARCAVVAAIGGGGTFAASALFGGSVERRTIVAELKSAIRR
jgi:O-antigen/teichoic acid export membrane protein